MKKFLNFISNNSLLILTLFFIAFIPLYPKLPLFDIKHTWVYIRLEDLLVALTWGVFLIHLILRKATLKTPLTVPIFAFWIIGALATLNGVLFIFPELRDVFPQIALLHYLRRLEYLSFFFLAFSAIKKKSSLTPVIITLTVTLIAIVIYGIGQRVYGFPAFLTMNEEFAKGVPLRLSPLSRVASTFAGHYDLAAYLILLIPIMGGLVFGFKKIWQKAIFLLAGTGALILLLMTNSRVSFSVYMVSIVVLLVLLKKKLFIIPVLALSILLLQSFPGISQRFASTFTQVDLAVDSRTGKPIGIVSEGGENDGKIVIEDKQSTGENLPQGSKYINIPSTSGSEFTSEIVYKKLRPGSGEEQIISRTGEVIVKKAFAYDVSFTTRLQGEWPRATEAFLRNIFLGSGYSSINLATDNNYLRILGETGSLGFLSFFFIFLAIGIYAFKILPDITDTKARAFVIGTMSGIVGLSLNAVLIDVFEASKVAFSLWLLVGVLMGVLVQYQKKPIYLFQEVKNILLSIPALLFYIVGIGFLVFSSGLSNYFVGDDFTWLRWAADCQAALSQNINACGSFVQTIIGYFTDSQNFFYRPGTKTYFFLMYPIFELFPLPFHVVSVLLHVTAASLIFFILNKLFGSRLWSFAGAVLFAVLSTHAESVYWISVTGTLITANLILFSLFIFLYWRENKNIFLFFLILPSLLIATFFQEFGVIGPVMLIAMDCVLSWGNGGVKQLRKNLLWYLLLFIPVILYYVLRQNAQSIWFGGDYSYNLMKLPFNFIGNAVGYILLALFGPSSLSFYSFFRNLSSDNVIVVALIGIVLLGIGFSIVRKYYSSVSKMTSLYIILGFTLFLTSLLPFLGLGNIAPRYNYLASFGVIIMLIALLRSAYARLSKRSKETAIAVIFITIALFAFYHVRELQRIQHDWKKAGEITNNTLVSLSYAYRNTNEATPSAKTFFFVNKPIRYGEAWVFPVGLNDALWFSFQNKDIRIVESRAEDEAFMSAQKLLNAHVFKYLENGDLVEVRTATSPAELNEE